MSTVSHRESAPMVGWYNPVQLLRTAQKVLISTVFGKYADPRFLEALGPATGGIPTLNCSAAPQVWIDYVADTGDGWDSTYAVAYTVAQSELKLRAPDGKDHETQRGQVLVFGGDEVYPTPSREEYERRLVLPFETALNWTDEPHPFVLAVPGNHDWYDNLVAFTRLFMSRDWFGGWKTCQQRSYFSVKLPGGWWLLGTDVQLGSDIDAGQVAYFKDVAAKMQPQDRIILCNAEPHWIYSHVYSEHDAKTYSESNLAYLEKIFKREISVFLAGDLHHYRRHESADRRQKITAGGGGAFLHPTHGSDVTQLEGGFQLKQSYPEAGTSAGLCWWNLAFLFRNPLFGLLPASLYVLTCWAVLADVGHQGLGEFKAVLHETVRTALASPVAAFWALLLFVGFLVFTDTHSKAYRWIAGSLHGLAHLCATFLLGWGASYFSVTGRGLEFRSISQLLLSAVIIFIGGWILGSLIMGMYLLVSLNVAGRHGNEAFSSLKCPDWKNFLRLRVTSSGELTIYPVGIERVPRRWKKGPSVKGKPGVLPDDPKSTPPALIEKPIVL